MRRPAASGVHEAPLGAVGPGSNGDRGRTSRRAGCSHGRRRARMRSRTAAVWVTTSGFFFFTRARRSRCGTLPPYSPACEKGSVGESRGSSIGRCPRFAGCAAPEKIADDRRWNSHGPLLRRGPSHGVVESDVRGGAGGNAAPGARGRTRSRHGRRPVFSAVQVPEQGTPPDALEKPRAQTRPVFAPAPSELADREAQGGRARIAELERGSADRGGTTLRRSATRARWLGSCGSLDVCWAPRRVRGASDDSRRPTVWIHGDPRRRAGSTFSARRVHRRHPDAVRASRSPSSRSKSG